MVFWHDIHALFRILVGLDNSSHEAVPFLIDVLVGQHHVSLFPFLYHFFMIYLVKSWMLE